MLAELEPVALGGTSKAIEHSAVLVNIQLVLIIKPTLSWLRAERALLDYEMLALDSVVDCLLLQVGGYCGWTYTVMT